MAEVVAHRLAHVERKRQLLLTPALAPDQELATPPANVAELEAHHLAGTQSQSRQQVEDCVITAAGGRASVTAFHQQRDPLRIQSTRKCASLPISYGW